MSRKAALLKEIESAPEVLQYLRQLKSKPSSPDELAIASESSLKKGWLLPEEDAAWKDL